MSGERTVSRWILFPAITMSLGWGLRGYIGGGPLGAMIPGAMVALALCLQMGRGGKDAGVIAAFGALGVGFGGSETYGQTVGLSIAASTMAWGLVGLAVKGAVWGLVGGALLGTAFVRDVYRRRDLLIGFALLVAGVWVGWAVVDQPKWIYFSDPVNKPRGEIWAGLLVGGLVYIAWLRWRSAERVPLRFAAWGLVASGVGFAFGGLLQSLGRQFASGLIRDYWKLMEFTFGFCFGAGLGWAARSSGKLAAQVAGDSWKAWVLGLVPGALIVADRDFFRFEYLICGVVLLGVSLFSASAAWQIAITITYLAFSMDLLEHRPAVDPVLGWGLVIVTTALVAVWVARGPSTLGAYLFLVASATLNALVHGWGPMAERPAPNAVLTTFATMAVVCVIAARRIATAGPGTESLVTADQSNRL